MPAEEQVDTERRGRGRPRDEAHRRAVLHVTERLLTEQPLEHVRVSEILREAKVARGTFYLYFDSKNAVAATLLEEVLDEVLATIQPFVQRAPDISPLKALRQTVDAGTAAWTRHRIVLRTAAQNWHSVPELAKHWIGFSDQFIDGIAGEIDRQRAAGVAPTGPDSRTLSAGLVYSSLHLLYMGGLEEVPALRDEQQAADVIFEIWRGAIYTPRAA